MGNDIIALTASLNQVTALLETLKKDVQSLKTGGGGSVGSVDSSPITFQKPITAMSTLNVVGALTAGSTLHVSQALTAGSTLHVGTSLYLPVRTSLITTGQTTTPGLPGEVVYSSDKVYVYIGGSGSESGWKTVNLTQ